MERHKRMCLGKSALRVLVDLKKRGLTKAGICRAFRLETHFKERTRGSECLRGLEDVERFDLRRFKDTWQAMCVSFQMTYIYGTFQAPEIETHFGDVPETLVTVSNVLEHVQTATFRNHSHTRPKALLRPVTLKHVDENGDTSVPVVAFAPAWYHV